MHWWSIEWVALPNECYANRKVFDIWKSSQHTKSQNEITWIIGFRTSCECCKICSLKLLTKLQLQPPLPLHIFLLPQLGINIILSIEWVSVHDAFICVRSYQRTFVYFNWNERTSVVHRLEPFGPKCDQIKSLLLTSIDNYSNQPVQVQPSNSKHMCFFVEVFISNNLLKSLSYTMLPMFAIIPCNYVHYHRNLKIIKPKNQNDTLGILNFLNSNEMHATIKCWKCISSIHTTCTLVECVACERKLILNSLSKCPCNHVLSTHLFLLPLHPVTYTLCVKHKHFIIPHEMCRILPMRKWSVQKCTIAQQTHKPIRKIEFHLLFHMHACWFVRAWIWMWM